MTNPLCGDKGASYVFGPQKGAAPETVKILDNNLRHYADVIKEQLKKMCLMCPEQEQLADWEQGLWHF